MCTFYILGYSYYVHDPFIVSDLVSEVLVSLRETLIHISSVHDRVVVLLKVSALNFAVHRLCFQHSAFGDVLELCVT